MEHVFAALHPGEEPVGLSSMWSMSMCMRDRIGGDINVAIDDSGTTLWATATVEPG